MYKLLHNKDYINLSKRHGVELIEFLSTNVDSFDITVNLRGIDFTPTLPSPIYDTFTDFVLFTLTNYSLESLKINDDYITFEAGFGAENFGSICKVSTEAIFQISIDNSILFINPNASIEQEFFHEEFNQQEQEVRSRKAFSFKK
ncbi:MAG TPA: hypothetical protein ENK66_00070 [Arcobacter sp.]|jgi:hypothetical protein|nr:hypothetical protein [Arcobacter sp.]